MANLLILSKDLPYPLDSGNTLRVYHPCRQLAKKHTCVLVTFGEPGRHVEELENQGIFKEIHLIRPPDGPRSFRRHLRWSNQHFTKLAMPEFYAETVRFLEKQIRKHRSDVVIVFPDILTEFVESLTNVRKIADNCDSTTLSYERYYAHQKKKMSTRRKLSTWLTLQRYRNFERKMADAHDRIVSISPADLDKLKKLNPASAHKIKLIPNGVHAELLAHAGSEPPIDNAIVFWGNLNFAPNHAAVQYFYHKVYQPYLSSQKIKWYIVGKNAGPAIQAMAAADENIIVTGFIESLYDFAARIPIMVNPMQIGSGLKNKVLEAFALHRLVISNALGVEAIIGAQPGTHYVRAEQPIEFADAILNYMQKPLERKKIGTNARLLVEEKYTWDKIGQDWNRLVEELTATGLGSSAVSFEALRRRA